MQIVCLQRKAKNGVDDKHHRMDGDAIQYLVRLAQDREPTFSKKTAPDDDDIDGLTIIILNERTTKWIVLLKGKLLLTYKIDDHHTVLMIKL